MKIVQLTAGVAVAALVAVTAFGAAHMLSPSAAVAADAAADAAASPLGRIDNFMLADQNLLAHELYKLSDAKAVVIVTQMNGCPIVRNIAPALKALQTKYKGQGVEFMMLNSSLADNREEVAAEAKDYGIDMPVLMDTNQLVGEQLGVTRTAEVIVVNPKTWQIMYRGPVDDRVTYERQKAEAEHKWADDAIAAVVAGKPVAMAKHDVEGCIINFPQREARAKAAIQKISYAKTIAPLVQEKCIACHQPGGIGPMQLTSYEKIKAFAPMIRETIRTKRMPPFHADPSIGHFNDDKSLSADQIKTLVHWIENGAPRGDGADPLAKVKFQAPEWPLGKPDVVLKIPAYTIPATGVVDYQRPFVVNPLTEGKWLKASTVKPGERQGVHHILTGYMEQVPANGRVSEASWGVSVGGYAVGSESIAQPKDVGTYVPAGGAIGFQNHYTPFGKQAVDNSEIGLYFYKDNEKPKLMMRGNVILDATINIPAGEGAHKEVAYLTFPHDALLYSAFPHAHYRAWSADVKIRYPDGTEKMLVALPHYDFNWQRAYEFKTPIKVPAGSKIITTYTYDNSKRNKANPDPKINVTWGEQSFQEMLYTALRYRWVDETTAKQLPQYDRDLMASRTMGMMDDNIDGKLQMSELRGGQATALKAAFAAIDANKDGGLDQAELTSAQSLLNARNRTAAR